jgi:hypothetical protein
MRRLLTTVVALAATCGVAPAIGPMTASAAPASFTPPWLAGNGLGVVRFGASAGAVTKALAPALGPPTARPAAGCGRATRQIAWNNLTVQFTHGTFSGYRYEIGSTTATWVRISTARGISLESTLGDARQQYSLTQSGTDFWRT